MTRFTDGEWHHLHPLTPLLRGGITFVAVIGFLLYNIRDILIDMVLGGDGRNGEPLVWLYESEFFWLAVLALFVGLALVVVGYYLSWRMNTFRITDEVVEVRSGIVFRRNRKGRLDRIQGINIARPLFARIFGAARLEVNVAGQDANIRLDYLGSEAADELRREVLRLASGTRVVAAQEVQLDAEGTPISRGAAVSHLIDQRVSELLAPELDPDLAPPESVVAMHTGRLIGSLLLSGFSVFVLLLIGGIAWGVAATGSYLFLIGVLPTLIGTGSFYITRFTRSLRYSIAGTPDGVRIGFGLLSTSNETLPPGRIHSIQVTQPLLWRAAGWWEIKVNRASTSSAKGAAGQANTTILPVGNLDDVRKVLALVLPDHVDADSVALFERGMSSKGGDDGFVNSPKRARWYLWFSQPRNGFATLPGVVVLRQGAVWRQLTIVPEARLQSVAISQGPVFRSLRLASLRVHTVTGPISPALSAVDSAQAVLFFREVADAAIASSSADTSHRWRSGEVAP
ncbi:PH domain-containing protein [Conyzicola nivalis]|uniref:Membrane protein n=1 Tax=Conyzicola nivalis TaxID=1477021 RepID=A0A916SP52_9MICO|nr:PH domain-containing protein [Conyzicola nivalis]GGB10664.1 membrane protein [Conyzicola nivalis]